MPKNKPAPQAETLKSGKGQPYADIRGMKTSQIGTSGTDISGHRFFEEYLTALSQPEGADVWDEMRRSDDQVKMLLRVVKNPIMTARWFVEAASEDEKDKEIADFIQFLLFDDMGTPNNPKTFDKFKREALTSVEFGYSLFEVTNKIVLDDPQHGSYVGLKGLDWRSPKTIEEWYIAKDGELLQVRQTDNAQYAQDVFIPGKFLLHIAPEMEGDLYEGISMLRPVYGNWKRKDFLHKIKMIGAERAAIGVPFAEIPTGQINSTSEDEMEKILTSFVAHEKQYIIAPAGWKISNLKIEFDAEAVQNIIKEENIGMAKSFLANFMELGLSGSGAYALGSDLSDIFLSGIEVYALAVTSPINAKLIPGLVKQNFGKQDKYPKLKIEGINDKGGKEFAEVVAMLGEKGLIQVSDKLKTALHQKFKLPDFDPDIPEDTTDKESPPVNNSAPLQPIQLSEIEYNLAEKSVGKNIEVVGKELSKAMENNMRQRGEKLVSQMLEIWRNAPRSKRMEQVNRLVVPGKNEYKKVIKNALAEIYVQATKGVKSELGGEGLKLAEKEEVRDLPAESKATGASQADLIVESQDADIRKNLFFSFTGKADTLPTKTQMEANLLDVVERYVTGPSIRTGGPNAAANAVNLARNAIFQQKQVFDKIESFIFTNPSPEAAICEQLAGRVFSKKEYVVSDKLPPLHHNCNSWIKAQLTTQSGNQPISPAGLTIQGTDTQIKQIEKSITL